MKFDSFDTNSTRRRAEQAHQDEERERLFVYVAKAYAELAESQALTSSNPDPQGRRKKLAGAALDYLIDVERVTKKALFNDPKLFAAWHRLLDIADDIETLPASTRRHIVRLCVPAYQACGLQPHIYFTPTRSAA